MTVMEVTDLSDRIAIQELYARYNWAIDLSDPAAFAATFTAAGSFVGSMGTMSGHAALAAFAERERLVDRGVMHWNGNIVVDSIDNGVAQARAYMMALVPGECGPIVERAGRYSDTIVHTSNGWKFAERRFSRVSD